MRDHQSRSGPGTPSRSRGISPSLAEEDMGSQLFAVGMKLEERRKRIEEEKKKMEMIMSKQREKVGQSKRYQTGWTQGRRRNSQVRGPGAG